MHLPFRIVVKPSRPSHARSSRPRWRLWLIAGVATVTVVLFITLALVYVRLARRPASASTGEAWLVIDSVPIRAMVEIDGRSRGVTPATLSLTEAVHQITLRKDGYAAAVYAVTPTAIQTTTLRVALWSQVPTMQRLRPAFPGATIRHADFLADGRIALTVGLPGDGEQQLWLMDRRGALTRRSPPRAAYGLAVSLDGEHVAYLAESAPSTFARQRLDEVWLTEGDDAGRKLYGLPADAAEQLVDLAWAPSGQSLLLVSREATRNGTARTQLRRLDVGGTVQPLVDLPTEMLAGSYVWSPSTSWLAFLTRSEQVTSLCLLNVDTGEVRYLADLNRDTDWPPPIPPVGWSPDGERLLYAAPAKEAGQQTGWLLGGKPPTTLFLVNLDTPRPQRLGEIEAFFPAWHPDGRLLAIGRDRSRDPLALRAVTLAGEMEDVGEIPLAPSSTYAVRWDAAHGQALVASRAADSFGADAVDYWLVRWLPEERQ